MDKPVCVHCQVLMQKVEIGIALVVLADEIPYYKIAADKFECPKCYITVYDHFGKRQYRHEKDFTVDEKDIRIR